MDNSPHFSDVAETFARIYTVDISTIRAKTQTLSTSPNSGDADGTIIYNGELTPEFDVLSAHIPNLETENFQDIEEDSLVTIHRVEQNLDEAIRYSQTCLQLRWEYMELAKQRNDTRFKGEEFLRLDLVHQEEVKAGLYTLPWHEAADDQEALKTANEHLSNQASVISDLFDTNAGGSEYASLMTDAKLADYVQTVAQIARDSTAGPKNDIFNGTHSTTDYRMRLEFANWSQLLVGVRATQAQLQGKLNSAKRKEDYLEKDVRFKAQRAAISRQLAYLQLAEHCRPGSAINYDERLHEHGQLFRSNLRMMVQRIKALLGGLRDIYGIEIALGEIATGHVLDGCAMWLLDAQDRFGKYKRSSRLSVTSVTSGKVLSKANGNTIKFSAEIDVDLNLISGSRHLLRGISIEYNGDHKRAINLIVVPPADSYTALSNNEDSKMLMVGRVYPSTAALDQKPQHTDVLWNGSPNGKWQITGTFNPGEGEIDEIILHVWTASN